MKDWAPIVRAFAAFVGGTFTLGGSIYIGFWLGTYLDNRFQSFGFSVLGIVLGIFAGLWQLYRLLSSVLRS